MKDSRGLYISKVYDLTEFDDQVSLYRQLCAYISNKPSTSTMLDFSNNQETQDTVERRDFFQKSVFKKVVYRHERLSRCNGKKDPLKRRDESIKVKVLQHQDAPHDLDIIVCI